MSKRQFRMLKGHGNGYHDSAVYKVDEKIDGMFDRIHERMDQIEKEEGIKLDSRSGCLWCFRPRMEGSLYCSERCQYKYEFHNGKAEVSEK